MTDRHEMSAAEYIRMVGSNADTVPGGSGRARKQTKGPTKSWLQFDQYLRAGGFGAVEHEHRFHATRRWRFDWFLPDQGAHGVAFEYDGLFGGRSGAEGTTSHGSVSGILRDSEKINAAQQMGIPVYRVNARSIQDGSAFTLAASVLRKQGE